RGAAELLGLGDHLQRERGLARRLGAVDLHHAPARQSADAERVVEHERAGRDGLDSDVPGLAKAHDRALAEALLDGLESGAQRLAAFFDAEVHEGLLWASGPSG